MEKEDVTEVIPQFAQEFERLLNAMTNDHFREELQEILRLKNAGYFINHGIINAHEKPWVVTWKSVTILCLVTVCRSLCW